jgi:ABC-type Co2+ transport system permease subunit
MEQKTKQKSYILQRIIGIIFGVIEAVLAFRLIFKLLGANTENAFVHGIYAVTQSFVGIFEGIFSQFTIKGMETTEFLEPATVIAMVVVALVAWAVLKLIRPR